MKKYVYLAAFIICFGWSDGNPFTSMQFTKPPSLAPQVQPDRWECLSQVQNLPTHRFYGWRFTRLSLDIPPDVYNPPIGDETTVPEPTTLVLMLVGGTLLVLFLKENK